MPAALCHLHCLLYLRKELNWEEREEDTLMHLSVQCGGICSRVHKTEKGRRLRITAKVAHLNRIFKKEKEKPNVFTPSE